MPASSNSAASRGSREATPGLRLALREPLPFRTLPEQIAAKLRQAILTGQLPPGARLVETRIAEQVRTSRGPVRDALALLERDGLVSKLPNRGACVLGFSERRLREVASLRAVLEQFAISSAVRNLTASHIRQLESLLRRMEVAARRQATQEFNDLDYRFHDTIFGASGHQTLHETWRGMQRQMRVLLASINPVGDNLHEVIQSHRAIFEAIQSGNLGRARRAIRAHFARVDTALNLRLSAEPSHRDREPQKSELPRAVQ